MAASRSVALRRCLTPHWRGVRGMVASRGFFGGSGDRPKESQSKVLSGDEGPFFSLDINRIKPEYMDEYIQLTGEHMLRVSESDKYPTELVGAWKTTIGPVKDQTTHIWQHTSYNTIMETQELLGKDKVWQEYREKRSKMEEKRSSQLLLPFTFWELHDSSDQREPKGLYEMRTYTLKPGTLIEWGQAWKEGINYRKDEAVGGWFSQIGEMHQVHHLWAYEDLQDRHETRQAAWEFPGWDECVVKTVPLIRYMVVRILQPTPYSPLK